MPTIQDKSVSVHKKSVYNSVKKSVYDLLDPEMKEGWGKRVNVFIMSLIILNTLAVILETVDSFNHYYHDYLRAFDVVSVIIFTVEYFLRLWSITINPKFRHPFYGRIKYIFTPGALIDLLAILPFYIHHLFHPDLRFIRTLRLMLFFRFLKLGRYMTASRVVFRVISQKREELAVSLLSFLFLIMLASCLMYYAEHQAQPQKFSNIPQTLWWAVCTLTTVGYGDMYPITSFGKVLTGVIILFGVGLLALPTGILASGFSEEYQKKKHKAHYCPHCGEKIE